MDFWIYFRLVVGLIIIIIGAVIILLPEFAGLIALILVIIGAVATFDAVYVSNN